jgi:hypothetical protein
MRIYRFGILLWVVCSPVLSARSLAQSTIASIRPGDKVAGVLSAKDPKLNNGKIFRAYRFDADSGRRYAIRLHSADFDAYIGVEKMVGGVTDIVAFDDNSGGGNDALVVFRPAETAPYAVVVTSGPPEGTRVGAYTLELNTLPDPAPPVPRQIAIGDSAVGSFTRESPTWENTSFPYDLFTFRARKGQSLAARARLISSRKSVGDIRFGRTEKNTFVPLGSSGGVSLFRRFTAPEDGDYTVRLMADGPVPYVLHVDERRPEEARTVVRGKTLTGTLDPRVGTDPSPYQDWSLSAREGERLAISAHSSEFDTYLVLNRRQGNNLARMAVNDDSAGNVRNSWIVATAPVTGEYVVRVQSADSAGGAYSLRVDTLARVEQHLRRGPIMAGQEVKATLSRSDSALDDGSPYQEWIYRAKGPNERLLFTMRSSDFDTFLSVGRVQGGKYVEFSSNDDALDDTNANHVSRVLIVAPAAGDFVIRANSMAADQLGAYTLRAGAADVEDRIAKNASAATRLAAGADTLARQLRIAEAIAKIDSALALDSSRVTNFNLNSVCWFGTLRGSATRVLRYCERAVMLDPSRTGIRDSRGVARALSGDARGAIEDFRAYAADTKNDAAPRDQRRAWAEALQAGTPPDQVFREAVRTELLKQ